MEFLEKNLEESEVKLTQLIYNNRDNLIEIKNKINTDDFINSNMKILFDYAVILYQKYDFQILTLDRIKQLIANNEDIDDVTRELLLIHTDIMKIDYDLDIKGEFEIYLKNLSLYRYSNFVDDNGGIEGIINKLSDFADNTDDMRDYLLDSIDRCFHIYKSKPIESDMEQGMEELLKEIENDDMEVGIKQRFNEYTDYFTGGIFKGVHFLGASSGKGKTTWTFPFYILPLLLQKDEDGECSEKILIIANEQDKKTFQKLFLVAIYQYVYRFTENNKKLKNRFIRRHRIERGSPTDLDKKLLRDTFTYYVNNFKKRIRFVFMPMFTPDDIENCIISNARKGYKNIILDTMKAEVKGEYQLLSNLATRLDMIAKANDLRIVATVQLAIHSMNRKYLDHTCLAESKQIVEIAEHSLYFRYTDLTELSKLTILRYKRDIMSDGSIAVTEEQLLHTEIEAFMEQGLRKNKDLFVGMKLMLVFVGKNRHGESDKIVLAIMNFDNMYYKELGIVEGLQYDKF